MWILPTYCRPDRCADVLASLHANGCSTPGIVVVNGRETEEEYRKLALPPSWTMAVLPENLGFAGALNATFDAHPSEPFYGFIADDEIALTPGWDKRLVEAAGSWRVSNGNDGWQSRSRVHGHVCIGGELARTLGCLAIRQCWHWYAFDDMWEAIDKELGVRTFCEDVRVEHRHFLNGGAFDMTYVAGGLHKVDDHRAFIAWRTLVLPDIVARIARARPSELVANGG
jgi:Glycosyl transferase family 2